jgi:hypothetical protein
MNSTLYRALLSWCLAIGITTLLSSSILLPAGAQTPGPGSQSAVFAIPPSDIVHLGDGIEPSNPNNWHRSPDCATNLTPTQTPPHGTPIAPPIGITSNIATWGSVQLYFVKGDVARTEAESLAGSFDTSVSVPVVFSGSLHLDAQRTTSLSNQSDTLHFVFSETQMLADYGQHQQPTLSPDVTNHSDAFVNRCGSKYVSAFVYGAKVGYDIDVSNLTDDERYTFAFNGDLSGSGIIPQDMISLSADATARFSKILATHSSQKTVSFHAFAFGAPAFVQHATSVPQTSSLASYDDVVNALNKIIHGFHGPALAPVAFVTSPYQGLAGTYSGRSANKTQRLQRLLADGLMVGAVYAHALDYQHQPWSSLTHPTTGPTGQLTRLDGTLSAIQKAYDGCVNAGITDSAWNSNLGPDVCNLAEANIQALQLGTDPSFGLATPPPIKGTWIAKDGSVITKPTTVSANVTQKLGTFDGTFTQRFHVDNAYLTWVQLVPDTVDRGDNETLAKALAPGFYNGKPPGSTTVSIDLPLNVPWNCGPPILPGLYNYKVPCAAASIPDAMTYSMTNSKALSSNMVLRLYNSFGQYCQWNVALGTQYWWQLTTALYPGPFTTGDHCTQS